MTNDDLRDRAESLWCNHAVPNDSCVDDIESALRAVRDETIEACVKALESKLDVLDSIPNDDPAPSVIVGSLKVGSGLLRATIGEIRALARKDKGFPLKIEVDPDLKEGEWYLKKGKPK